MKKLLRGIAFSLALLFLFTSVAFASELYVTRSSSYIANTSAEAKAMANHQIRISFSITGTGRMSELGATTIYLYEDDGNSTRLAKTYRSTDPNYPNMMAQNTFYHGSNVIYDGVAGYKYYASVHFKAGDSTGSDTTVGQTYVVTAQNNPA